MDELAKRFADLAEKFGPNVFDAALGAARMEARSTLASGALCIIVGACGLDLCKFLWKMASGIKDDMTEGPAKFLVIVLALIFCIPIISGVWDWINPWTWTAMSNPELWLAKKAFKL